MKTFAVGLVLMFFGLGSAWADTVYVVAKMAPLYSAASAASAKVSTLTQGTSLVVEEKGSGWLKVTSASGTGWVRTMFTGDKPVVLAADASVDTMQLTTVVSRKRASAYTSSAAATRGLSHDNVRERENLSFKDYDFQAATWLASFQYSEAQVEAFAFSEGILH